MKAADIIAVLVGGAALVSLLVKLGASGSASAVPDREAELHELCDRQRSIALIVGTGVVETLRREGETDPALASRIAAAAREDDRAVLLPAFDRYVHSEEGRIVVAEGVRLHSRIRARRCPPVADAALFKQRAERNSPVLAQVLRELRLPPFREVLDAESR